MPVLSQQYLNRLAHHIFETMGVPSKDAAVIAEHLVGANLAGHDSHGVIQIISYVDRVKKGQLKPAARIEVVSETATTARINGNWGFGYVVTTRAVEMAIEKAHKSNVAAISIFQQGHIGRLADYTTALANAGMIGQLTADSGRTSKQVVPFGGRMPCLGTNPISIAIPSNQKGPVFIDMATSVVASGKLSVAKNRKQRVPDGWLLDRDGNPTTDPANFAAILPLGGSQGHKGYGLSFMIEAFAGILTGIGYGVDPKGWHNDGCLLMAINVSAFRPLADFKREVDEMIRIIKSTPPAAGFQEVMYPGEPEYRNHVKRSKEGIFVEDATWEALQRIVEELGICGVVGQP